MFAVRSGYPVPNKISAATDPATIQRVDNLLPGRVMPPGNLTAWVGWPPALFLENPIPKQPPPAGPLRREIIVLNPARLTELDR